MSTAMNPLPSRAQTVPSSRFWFNRQVQKSIGLYKIVASTTPKDYKSTKGKPDNLCLILQRSLGHSVGPEGVEVKVRCQEDLENRRASCYIYSQSRDLSPLSESHFFWINSKSTCLISRRLLQKYYILPGRIRRMASCYLRMNALDVKQQCCPILWTLGTYASYALKTWLVQIDLCSKCVKEAPKFKDSV